MHNPGNYTDLSGEVMTVVGKRYAPDFYHAYGYEMYLGNGRLCFQMIDTLNEGSNFYNLAAEQDLRDGKFHHVAVTVQRNSATGIRFYVDGQLIATFDPTAVRGDLSNTWPLQIGNHPTPGARASYRGIIDEVSLYNRALSSNEIAAIYNAGGAGKRPLALAPPVVFSQPTNQTADVGGTATFTVGASGPPPLFYQWSFNGTDIPGATNPVLTLTNVQTDQAGRYGVLVANAGGSTNSANAVLTVLGATSCDPAPSGLVAWWRAEGNANDSIGANTGILVNGATFATGKAGQAFSFNGAAQYVGIPQSPSLNAFSNQMTIEFWMYANPGNSMATFQGLVTSDYYGIEISSGLGFGANGINWYVNTRNGAYLSSNVNGGGIPVSAGQWHHIAGTYDGNKLQLYIDGQPKGTPEPASGMILPMLATSFVAIGSDDGRTYCGCAGRYFWGLIDEASIYNRALSAGEIAAIYNAGGAGKCPLALAPPVIFSQPTNQTVGVGGTAIFRVGASGPPPLFYQWSFNGTDIPGATNPVLTLTNVQPAQAGRYAALVANAGGSTNSANAVLTVPGATSCDPAPSGLVAWWRAEGNADDSIGANNGMLTSGASFAAGRVGQAFSFNGIHQFVKVPQTASLNAFSNQMTIEFWMYANPGNLMNNYQGLVTSDYYGIEISDGYGGNVGINWYLNTTTGEHLISSVNGGGIPVSSGVWHHIAGTYDGAKLQLYIDGLPIGNAPTASGIILPMLTNSFVAIGSDDGRTYCGCTGRYFWGLLDEVSLYNRALSSNEIAAIYNAGSAGKCLLSANYVTGAAVLPPQPTIATVKTGSNLQLTWPISAGTFHVQSADSPLGPWTDAIYTVTTNGANAIVTVTATNQQQYFRLMGQSYP